jgi:hypothetical protein
MTGPVTRRGWLAALGAVAASHALGCAPEARPAPRALAPGPVAPPPAPAVVPGDEASLSGVSEPPALAAAAPPPEPPPALELALPPRKAGAETGSKFIERIEGLGRAAIDEEVIRAITAGNVPTHARKLVPISLSDGHGERGKLWVACDYLAVGSDEDFIRMPMTSAAAQRLANVLDASLPTPRLVDLIYEQAPAKLPPSYIDGGPTEGTLDDFLVHHEKLEARRKKAGYELGVLTAGHKKDIVLSARLAERDDRVAIYGWHKRDGEVIQPLSCKHSCRYADYSHGVRLVAQKLVVDGKPQRLSEVLADEALADLLSDEGPLPVVSYPTVLPEYVASDKKKSKKKDATKKDTKKPRRS